MLELLGRAVVLAVPAVALFYVTVVGVLLRGGGLEKVPGAVAAGCVVGGCWVVAALWWML